jgi:four helix bundle protein
MEDNRILQRNSYDFAKEIVFIYQQIRTTKQEYELTKQLLRSGTAIGALVREAEFAQSRKDFVNKLSISLKEANETAYWLDLLKDTGYLDFPIYSSLIEKCRNLIGLLVNIIKKTKQNGLD